MNPPIKLPPRKEVHHYRGVTATLTYDPRDKSVTWDFTMEATRTIKLRRHGTSADWKRARRAVEKDVDILKDGR